MVSSERVREWPFLLTSRRAVPPPPHTHTLYIRIVVSRHDRQCDDRTALDTDRFMKAADTAPPPNMLNSRPNEQTMSVPVCLYLSLSTLANRRKMRVAGEKTQAIILFQWARNVPASS